MFETCSLRLFLTRVTYTYRYLKVVLSKEMAKITNIFALKVHRHRVMQVAKSFFHISHSSAVCKENTDLSLQHLVKHVRRTLGTMQWWSKVVNFTGFVCLRRSVTNARVATSEFFANLLYKIILYDIQPFIQAKSITLLNTCIGHRVLPALTEF